MGRGRTLASDPFHCSGIMVDVNQIPDRSCMTGVSYNRLTPIMALRLAAPHTWPGPSILTSILGGLLAIAFGYAFSPGIWIMLLAAVILMQSSVNTLNDWADFRKGTDTIENSDDPTDAVLVYENPNPKHVLALGIAYMAAAFVLGIICIVWGGSFIPLVFAIVGALVIVAYSSGKLPISYLPLGEVVSGIVMGCLIPLAILCIFAAKSGSSVSWGTAIISTIPFAIGIGMVMATQNNCDIERDTEAGRKTLPIVLGHELSVLVYKVFVVIWMAVVAAIVLVFFRGGIWVLPVMLFFALSTLKKLFWAQLVPAERGPLMGAINKGNLFINGAFLLAIVISLIPITLV